MTKERRLAPDFEYSTPYTTDADPGLKTIHAYSDQAAARKRKFLHDASQLLLAVGRELRAYGFTASKVRTNEAGVAVSGEVYGHYGQPWGEREIFLTVDTTCMNGIIAPPAAPGEPLRMLFAMTTRHDGIVVVGRWYGPRPKARGSAPMGPNVYLDANNSSRELALASLRLVDFHLFAAPAPAHVQGSLFDLAA
ncbi:MAG: hypothetical protein ACJ74Q_15265 [Pyrinomonadaceae bacterium]